MIQIMCLDHLKGMFHVLLVQLYDVSRSRRTLFYLARQGKFSLHATCQYFHFRVGSPKAHHSHWVMQHTGRTSLRAIDWQNTSRSTMIHGLISQFSWAATYHNQVFGLSPAAIRHQVGHALHGCPRARPPSLAFPLLSLRKTAPPLWDLHQCIQMQDHI